VASHSAPLHARRPGIGLVLAVLSLVLLEETYGKDLDYLED
jgi:hypothetical protein